MAVSSPQHPSIPPPALPPNALPRSTISLNFAQGGSTCLLRPNTVVRGQVELKLIKPCYASGIRVKLKAEESAIVLGQESNGDTVRQKYRQTVITLFDTEVMVSGSDNNDNELANWTEIAPGTHTFPFALKVPNVNFPPCIPDLEGFTIRYIWTAHVDGPFEPSLSSEEVLCQFIPNVLAPKPMEWTYHDIVGAAISKNSSHQLHKQATGIALDIRMHQQIYVPGDPLSMATTVINNSQNKVVGIDVVLRRTVKGTFTTTYANLSNQVQVDIMTNSVECKVRPGETGQVDILTTIPPSSVTHSIPTFESNFLKVFYELVCIVRVKRSVFAGGDTSYQCTIPIPIATHNIDNPMINGRTPRWTKSRMQPYFFEPSWSDPVGDLPAFLANEVSLPGTTTPLTTGGTSPTGTGRNESPTSTPSPASASAVSQAGSPGTSSSAMQEFLNGGSAELYRERTLKKSLTRSKSLKDIQSSRLNGSSWRAERDQLLNQRNEIVASLSNNKSITDLSQGQGSSNSNNKRSPPLGPRSRPSNEDRTGSLTSVDSNGNVGYTPPPPSSNSSSRPPKSSNRDMTLEQQAEIAKKASRRILPNQGSYTNEGILPPELANTEGLSNSNSNNSNNSSANTANNDGNNNAAYPMPTPGSQASGRVVPRRNASLSQRTHQSNNNYIPDQESLEAMPRGGHNAVAQYEANNGSNMSRGRSYNGGSDQGHYRNGQEQQQNGHSSAGHERIPYQHSLPAHQQPPGVLPPGVLPPSHPTSPSISPSGSSSQLERSPSRKDGLTINGALSSPTFAAVSEYASISKTINTAATKDEDGPSGSNTSSTSGAGLPALTKVIQPWERVERIHHQDWFRPGPHQTGALQTFEVSGISPSQQQAIPVLKKGLQRPIDVVQALNVDEHL